MGEQRLAATDRHDRGAAHIGFGRDRIQVRRWALVVAEAIGGACKQADPHIILRHNDGEVMPTLELRKDFVRMIRKHKPEVVIAMDPQRMYSGNGYINHPDHRAVAVATMDAIAPVASMPLMYPELGEAHKVREVWIQWTDDPDTWVDISETEDQKVEALRQHKSQVGDDVVGMVRKWDREAGKGLAPAETFKVIFLEKREEVKAEAKSEAAQAESIS